MTRSLGERGIAIEVLELHQSSVEAGNDGQALTLIEYRHRTGTRWAAGIDRSVLTASLKAIIAAANNSLADSETASEVTA